MLKMVSLLEVLLEAVLTRRSECGTSLLPESFISERTIIYSLSPFCEHDSAVVFSIHTVGQLVAFKDSSPS
jgi:hypothetical protein